MIQASLMVQMVNNPPAMQETQFWSLDVEDPLEKGMATHSSILFGRTAWTEDYNVHGILQARILEWVAFPFSRGSSQPRDRTQVSSIAGGFFTSWATRESLCVCVCVWYIYTHEFNGCNSISKQEKLTATYKLNYYIEYLLFPLIPGSLTAPTPCTYLNHTEFQSLPSMPWLYIC